MGSVGNPSCSGDNVPPCPSRAILYARLSSAARRGKDSDSLRDYSLLGGLVDLYVKGDKGIEEIVAAGYDGSGRVQAAPVPAGHEDLAEDLRPRPAAESPTGSCRRRARRKSVGPHARLSSSRSTNQQYSSKTP